MDNVTPHTPALLDDIGSDDLPDHRSLVDVVRIGYRLRAAIKAMREMQQP